MKLFKFTKDEDGAVTVDWVVLTSRAVEKIRNVLQIEMQMHWCTSGIENE